MRDPEELLELYRSVRDLSTRLCAPLEVDDHVVQSMESVSPPKWHLGHTTWFFEKLLLEPNAQAFRPYHPSYGFIFNSYYESFGERVDRPRRGTLSRPPLHEVLRYRSAVDEQVRALLLGGASGARYAAIAEILVLGVHHEQQHQELLMTDIKHILATSPLAPSYAARPAELPSRRGSPPGPRFIDLPGGLHRIGWDEDGFAYDNERPAHRVFLDDFRLGERLVSTAEYAEFVEAGGYRRPELWLSDGWEAVRRNGWEAPLYWKKQDGRWRTFTLAGWLDLVPGEPVCHVSYYEADAFARWAGRRLPREAEWEVAARSAAGVDSWGTVLETGAFHPIGLDAGAPGAGFAHLLGEVWEWTASAYLPYPGYRRPAGPVGEYNAKFMVNQMVLRGGSCVTPRRHLRVTYRNFFPADTRWQFSGIRLAE